MRSATNLLLLVCSCCFLNAVSSQCVLGKAFGGCSNGIELITNGDFNTPVLSQDWKNFGSSISGWSSSSSNGIELWKQGYISPSTGAKNQKTGQHLELSARSRNGQVTTSFVGQTCGEAKVKATLSFEFWERPNYKVSTFGFILKKGSQVVLDEDLSSKLNTKKWISYSTTLTIENGASYQLTFKENSASSGGTHINAVSLKAHCSSPGFDTIDQIVEEYDFIGEAKNDNHLNIGLAPSFGKLNKNSVKLMDEGLKVMIASVTRDIAKLSPSQRNFDTVLKILEKNPVTQPKGSTQTRKDSLNKKGTNFFKFDGSADSDVVREVRTWFTNLVNDADIIDSTKINIDVLAKIVAATGVSVDSFTSFFFGSDSKKKDVLDIGVLRYPDIDQPYFKVYHLKLVAWSKSTRVLFVQRDTNGINGEMKVAKFEPKPDAIAALGEEVIEEAVAEAEDLFG